MPILLLTLMLLYSESFGAQTMATPKAECETLMNAAFPFAEKMLREHGEFFPYGAALKANGEIVSVAGYDGREQPPSTEIIRLIKRAFVQGAKAGQYKATALVYDVKVALPSSGQKSDAIAVSLNHRENYSVIVLRPYQLKKGQLTLGEVFVQKGEADVFPSK
jgi:hypothetical protein